MEQKRKSTGANNPANNSDDDFIDASQQSQSQSQSQSEEAAGSRKSSRKEVSSAANKSRFILFSIYFFNPATCSGQDPLLDTMPMLGPI